MTTRGTFFPAAEATTPRRSPRLAARRLHQRAEAPGATVSIPVRGALRDCIWQRERGGASLFDEVETVVKSQFQKLETAVVIAESPSKLSRYLLVTRKLKVYDEDVGPHDALRLVVAESREYKLMAYEKTLQEGTIETPFTASSLPILGRVGDAEWVVCRGVKGYSTYKSSIGYDMRRVAVSCWPPDTARDSECSIFYEKHSTQKTQMCEKCTSLKWHLAARKREHDQLSPGHRLERQQVGSTVQFDNLSPASKKARLGNMRKEITNLRAQVHQYSDKVERIAVTESQNEDMSQLVQAIQQSQHGQHALQTIYKEAEATGCGRGDVLKAAWEKDAVDMCQFYQDQKNNGEL